MGGTFDPIHHGHLVAASEVASKFELDDVIFVPTGDPWQKSERAVSPAEDRYLMTVIATASNPRFSVSRVDIDRPGPTYTTDTLSQLRAELTVARPGRAIDARAGEFDEPGKVGAGDQMPGGPQHVRAQDVAARECGRELTWRVLAADSLGDRPRGPGKVLRLHRPEPRHHLDRARAAQRTEPVVVEPARE